MARLTGMGLFHVSENAEFRTEVYYHPDCDTLHFMIMSRDPKVAVDGGHRMFSMPYLMYDEMVSGQVAVGVRGFSELRSALHEIMEAKRSIKRAFMPFCESFPAFMKKIKEVRDQAKRARKKAGIPEVRDAAAESHEEHRGPEPGEERGGDLRGEYSTSAAQPYGPFGGTDLSGLLERLEDMMGLKDRYRGKKTVHVPDEDDN